MVQLFNRDIVLHGFPAGSKQFFKNLRHRQDGWAKIKSKAILIEPVQFSSDMVIFLI
ncbi:Uncharacterised protein [Mycobacteroides abscessus subsp. abscessus]|nr:Uncharacterised protein [Mycobacteroides abscessus subsp. abscessus]